MYKNQTVSIVYYRFSFFFFNDTATTEIYPLSLHDALPISGPRSSGSAARSTPARASGRWNNGCSTELAMGRSEEHTSELQSLAYLVCRLLLEKKTADDLINRHALLLIAICYFAYGIEMTVF